MKLKVSMLSYCAFVMMVVPGFVLGQSDGASIELKLLDQGNTSNLRVQLTVTNRSGTLLTYPSSYPFSDYELAVVNADGKKLALKEMCQATAKDPRVVQVQSAILVQLSPGESNIEEFDLGKCFDLEHSGKVTITASRLFPHFNHATLSNSIAAELK